MYLRRIARDAVARSGAAGVGGLGTLRAVRGDRARSLQGQRHGADSVADQIKAASEQLKSGYAGNAKAVGTDAGDDE